MKRQCCEGQCLPPVCLASPILQCMAYLSRQWLYGAGHDRPLSGHLFTFGPVGAGKTVTESRFIRNLSALTTDRPAAHFDSRHVGEVCE